MSLHHASIIFKAFRVDYKSIMSTLQQACIPTTTVVGGGGGGGSGSAVMSKKLWYIGEVVLVSYPYAFMTDGHRRLSPTSF